MFATVIFALIGYYLMIVGLKGIIRVCMKFFVLHFILYCKLIFPNFVDRPGETFINSFFFSTKY